MVHKIVAAEFMQIYQDPIPFPLQFSWNHIRNFPDTNKANFSSRAKNQ